MDADPRKTQQPQQHTGGSPMSTVLAFVDAALTHEGAAMIATSQMFAASARRSEPLDSRTRAALVAARKPVRPDQLVDAINHMLAARPECDGLEFAAGALAPATPDEDGCNWRPHGLRLRVAHGPSTRALGAARQVVELARLRYDLADLD
jgi:hypothetical protein